MTRSLIMTGVLAVTLGVGLSMSWILGGGLGPRPELALQPAEIDFGEIAVGEHEHRFVMATNLGDAPLRLETVRVDAPFHTARTALELAPGDAAEIIVSVVAREAGQTEATLHLAGPSLPRGRLEIPVRMQVPEPPKLEIAPAALSFGKVQIDREALALVTFANSGGAPLRVESLAVGPPFRPDALTFEIAPGEEKHIQVAFGPTAARPARSIMTVRSNDPNRAEHSVLLRGEGSVEAPATAMSIEPPVVDFGQVPVGESERRWLVVRNDGDEPLAINSSPMSAPFYGRPLNRTVWPRSKYRFPIAFAPRSSGGSLAPLVIYSNDPSRAVSTISLLGEAVAGGAGLGGSRAGDGGPDGVDVSAPGTEAAGGVGGGGIGFDAAGDPVDVAGIDGDFEQGILDALDRALDNEGGNEFSEDPIAPVEPGIRDDSVACIGSYCSPIVDADIRSIEAGGFQLDLAFPEIDQALGEFVSIDPVTVQMSVAPDGSIRGSAPLTITDAAGNPTIVSMEFTTESVQTFLPSNKTSQNQGQRLGPDGIWTGVGSTVMPPGSANAGQPLQFEIHGEGLSNPTIVQVVK